MAKSSKETATIKPNAFSMDELAEVLVNKMGGIEALAETISSSVKTGNLVVKDKMITLIVRMLQNATPKVTGTAAMTDEEIDLALNAEILRVMVSMPEEEYRDTISRIEQARGQSEQGSKNPEEERTEVVDGDSGLQDAKENSTAGPADGRIGPGPIGNDVGQLEEVAGKSTGRNAKSNRKVQRFE